MVILYIAKTDDDQQWLYVKSYYNSPYSMADGITDSGLNRERDGAQKWNWTVEGNVSIICYLFF